MGSLYVQFTGLSLLTASLVVHCFIEPVLQHEHGGPVLLRPLIPHAVVEPPGTRLALASDEEKG